MQACDSLSLSTSTSHCLPLSMSSRRSLSLLFLSLEGKLALVASAVASFFLSFFFSFSLSLAPFAHHSAAAPSGRVCKAAAAAEDPFTQNARLSSPLISSFFHSPPAPADTLLSLSH